MKDKILGKKNRGVGRIANLGTIVVFYGKIKYSVSDIEYVVLRRAFMRV